ncbi:MAG: tRNA lysidine(34) synthetase TilS [Anaerolineaceae bacterium]|jgi:tRNA(Ile)-lysidine synthase|nr:tRNA lysidine(34) synthetase TilS [Anaerolineaceae bacterium]
MELEKIQKILETDCALTRDKPLVVGVSGGADSLCLLDVFYQLGYPLIVAHFDHGLRPESAQDAEQVRLEARARGLAFVTDRQDVTALARAESFSIEEAARVARYGFLYRQARQYGAQGVAVAHTADDQVETVLMHLVRGAGLAGLKGMTYRIVHPEWDAEIPLLRPLLGVWRSEIEAWCVKQDLRPVHDPSNADTTFFRNRLRHELIPYLGEYNPRIKEVVWRMSQSLAGDYEVLQLASEEAWQRVCLRLGEEYVELAADVLAAYPRGMQRSLIRRAIACLRPVLRDVDFDAVERAAAFVAAPADSGQMDLIANLIMWVENSHLFLAERHAKVIDAGWPQMPSGVEISLPVPGDLKFEGWHLTVNLLEDVDVARLADAMQDRWQTWLDVDLLTLPLVMRTRRPGDRFRPLGMDGHSMKLSDFWVNEGLNRRARDGWPLVCSGEEIASVPGFRPAHPFRITADTQRIVHLQWKNGNEQDVSMKNLP